MAAITRIGTGVCIPVKSIAHWHGDCSFPPHRDYQILKGVATMETLEIIMTVLTMFGMLVWLLVSLGSPSGTNGSRQ